MPKMKSHSGAKKRFRKTGKGKLKRAHAYRRHHAWAKTTDVKRNLRKTGYFADADESRVLELLPY